MSEDDEIASIHSAAKATHQLVVEIHAAFVATQLGVIAITEQLVDAGAVDPQRAAERMRELTAAMTDLTEAAVRATQTFRDHVASLSAVMRRKQDVKLALVPKE
jgi:argininosuccinate lyase